MDFIEIDLDRIRQGLPDRAQVRLTKYNGINPGKGSPCIECFIPSPSLSLADFEMCKQWQREILGEAIQEFYTEEEGRHWFVFLKRTPTKFVNCEDGDVNSWSGMSIVKDGKLTTA